MFSEKGNVLFLYFTCLAVLVLASCSGGAGVGGSATPHPANISPGGTANAAAGPALPSTPPLSSLVARVQQPRPPVRARSLAAALGAQTTLFSDSFQEQNFDAWTGMSGSWSICRPSGGFAACAANGSNNALFAGNTSWDDYTMQAAVVIGSLGSTREGVDVVVRARDFNHFYELELVQESDGSEQWEMWSDNGGQWSNLARGYTSVKAGVRYVLRLQAAGSLLTASLSQDGGATFSVLGTADDSTYGAGMVALRAWGGVAASFDNVAVTAPAQPGPGPSASPGPTPSPQPTSAGGNVATYQGCNVFTPGDYYNADVTNVAPDPDSAQYIASVTGVKDANFYASVGIEQINIADSSTPLYTVQQKVSYHSFPVPEPWQAGYYIEPGGDAHSMVLLATPPACHMYELYDTTFANNVLSAYSGINYDLSQPWHVQAPHHNSAMASGLPLFAGMVKYEEIAGGVRHALNISAIAHSLCNCFTAPASASDGLSYSGPSSNYQLPYGAHLRLKASFDDSNFGPQSKAITQALKHYGAFIADTGCCSSAIYTANPTNGGAWDNSDLGSLRSMRLSDFDVLPIGTTSS